MDIVKTTNDTFGDDFGDDFDTFGDDFDNDFRKKMIADDYFMEGLERTIGTD